MTSIKDNFEQQSPSTSDSDIDSELTDLGVARVGEAVAARRRELDLPQRDLAKRGVISTGSLIDLEKGRRWPRRSTRAKLEEALDWPPGHIARLRAQLNNPSYDPSLTTAAMTENAPLMIEVVEVALTNITTRIDALPDLSDPEFSPAANAILADLRRIEASASRAAQAASGQTSVVLILGAVRKTYKNLMLRAARSAAATLGQQVFAVRHRSEISIEEFANATGIPIEVITAAESEAHLDQEDADALSTALAAFN